VEVSGNQIDEIVQPLLNQDQRIQFKEQMDVDFAFSWLDRARLRGSAFTQRVRPPWRFRIIPTKIPSFEDLGLPTGIEWIAGQTRGFVSSRVPRDRVSRRRWLQSLIE